MRLFIIVLALAVQGFGGVARAEDGYDLWLRFRPVEQPWRDRYIAADQAVVAGARAPPQDAAPAALERGLSGLLGATPARVNDVDRDGAVVIGTPASSAVVARLALPLSEAGREG